MKFNKLFNVKKTKYGVFLEPKYNISKLSKIEGTIKRSRRMRKG